jgi:hypothetical protein
VRTVLRFLNARFRRWIDNELWLLRSIASSGAIRRADLTPFDRYCELNKIPSEDEPAAFADWLAQEIRNVAKSPAFANVPDDDLD